MKTYPTILKFEESKLKIGDPVWAFDKIDGSNLRFEWSKKKGWTGQGTRKHLFNRNDPIFGAAVNLFHNTFADHVMDISKKHWKKLPDELTFYFEFWGLGSFAGKHNPNYPQMLYLIDIWEYKKGFLLPKDLLKWKCAGFAPVIETQFTLTQDFVNSVRENKLDLEEGVVLKHTIKRDIRAKIKTFRYLEKLKQAGLEE